MRPIPLRRVAAAVLAAAAFACSAPPRLIAVGSIDLPGGDLSGLTGPLESGLPGNNFGGIGSGLAWAGGSTFLAVPDRGPNATAYPGGELVDNTTAFIARFHTLDLALEPVPSAGLPWSVTPTLSATTLLHSDTPLHYGSTAGLPSGVPARNEADKFFFTGRSDGFEPGLSTNPSNARLDPEGVRVSRDGRSVFVSDEYGPYVYQFDRATGRRLRSFALPAHFAIDSLYALGASEIAGNTSGRVTNKGMEGLAITPDGKTLVGFVQSPLLQDGGDGGRANRIVTIDIASGATREYAYDNYLAANKKAYNSSEILALNSHQFLVLERDGKGLGDGSKAVVKQLWAVDIAGAADVSHLSGEAALLAEAPAKTLFLDIAAELMAKGFANTAIPSKLEGIAFGADIVDSGVVKHTLYLSNDNDFVPAEAGPNAFFVFAFTDADLAAAGLSLEPQVFNVAPSADAGPSRFVPSSQVVGLTLEGRAADEDGDALACRWSEGDRVLKDWFAAAAGVCPLELNGSSFGLGRHALVLQVSDAKDTASDTTCLTVGNSAPVVAVSGEGTYPVHHPVVLSATAADFDGDFLRWAWKVDGRTRCAGSVATPAGGAPVDLTDCQIGIARGIHSAVLTVTDGVNAPVRAEQTIRVVDMRAPHLSPVAHPSVLWPADGRMVDVVIHPRAHDDGPIRLAASVSSNGSPVRCEPHGKKPASEWTEPSIDPRTGTIRLKLRAVRDERGRGRRYTVDITATDREGHVSRAALVIPVASFDRH